MFIGLSLGLTRIAKTIGGLLTSIVLADESDTTLQDESGNNLMSSGA